MVTSVTDPFLIGLFVGNKKPSDVSEYTQALIKELDILIQSGLTISIDDVDYSMQFTLFLCYL